MATREKIFDFDASESIDNLRNLRAEIKELKTSLEELEIGSAEYKKTAEELGMKQERLSTLMKAARQTYDELPGSINEMNRELRELTAQWRAADKDTRAALTPQIVELKAKVNEANESIGNFQHNVGNYTNSIVDAFAKMGISVTSLTAPLKKIGVDIGSIDTSVKVLIGTFKLFSGATIASLVSGFKAATAGVQSFIAGLNGIKAAILATGIGALVVALGTLAAYWDDISEAIWGTSQQMKDMEYRLKNLDSSIRSVNIVCQEQVIALEAQDASTKKVLETQLFWSEIMREDVGKELNNLYNLVMDTTLSTDELTKALEKYEAVEKQYDKLLDEERILKAKIAAQDVIEQRKKEEEAARQAAAAARKRAEEEKKIDEEGKRLAQEASDELAKQIDAAMNLQKAASEATKSAKQKEIDAYNEQKKELEKWSLDTTELTRAHNQKMAEYRQQDAEDAKAKALEKLEFEEEMRQKRQETADTQSGGPGEFDIDAIVERNNAEFEAAKALNDAKIALNKELMLSYDETSEEYQRLLRENEALAADTAQKQADRDKKNSDAYDKLMKKRAEATKGMVSQTSAFLKAASQAMGENTKAAKGFAIASTVIDTIAAAIAGFKAGYNQWKDMPGPLAAMAPVQGAINAAAALASGYAQVQKIMSVDPTGSNAGGAASATAIAIPNIEGLSSPMEYTRQVTTQTEQEELNRDNRVYILEEDIQTSNNRVRVREEETTF